MFSMHVDKFSIYFPLKRCQSCNGYGYEDERLSHYFIFDFKSLLYGFLDYFLCFIESQQSYIGHTILQVL